MQRKNRGNSIGSDGTYPFDSNLSFDSYFLLDKSLSWTTAFACLCNLWCFFFSSPDSTYDSLDTPLFVAKASDMDLPVRWLAPESLIHHHFLTASDVYGFGMLVYEVLTYGCTPYRNVLKDEEVSNLVSNGDIETRTCDRIFLIKHETSGISQFFIALVISV